VNGVARFVNMSLDAMVAGPTFALTFAVAGSDVAVTTPTFNVYQAKANTTASVRGMVAACGA
jgi:hypothetical protein